MNNSGRNDFDRGRGKGRAFGVQRGRGRGGIGCHSAGLDFIRSSSVQSLMELDLNNAAMIQNGNNIGQSGGGCYRGGQERGGRGGRYNGDARGSPAGRTQGSFRGGHGGRGDFGDM